MQRFYKASSYLSKRIYQAAKAVPAEIAKNISEIRLRAGKPLSFISFGSRFFVSAGGRLTEIPSGELLTVSSADIKESFARICEYSVYTYTKNIASGFVTVGGGHRAGIYGTAVYEKNEIASVRDVGGINLRISREFKGCAEKMLSLLGGENSGSFLLCGAPATGKTTLLRDAARLLSNTYFKKVSVIDERGEIAAVCRGTAQNDVGIQTDVLDGYLKSDGIMQAVRSLSPEYIICDEIGADDDFDAIMYGINSGVNFAAAVHASVPGELYAKKGMSRLLKSGAFSSAVFLESGAPCKIKKIYKISESGEICQ